MQTRPPTNQARLSNTRQPSPPPPPPRGALTPALPPLPAPPTRKPTFGLLSRALAVLLLAGVSVGLGAAFALSGRVRTKHNDGGPVVTKAEETKAEDGSAKEVPASSLPESAPAPSADEETPSRQATPASTFDVPRVAPQLPRSGAAYALAQRINRDVQASLAAEKIPASPLSGDAEFVRRVHLDLVGRIPTRDRVVAFLDSSDPQKRAKLIDELLASPEFGRHLARIWADALIKRDFDNNKNLRPEAFVAWLAEQINTQVGWDRIVTEMITANGPESSTPQTFFVLANLDNRQPSPSKLTGSVGNLFMGIQIQCAECHQHPMTKEWGMDDFWGVAAFFGHTRAERAGGDKNKKGGPATIKETDAAKAPKAKKGPASGLAINVPDPNDPRKVVRTAKGKFFASNKPIPGGGGPYRPHLAAWLTAKDNPYFTPATVNRVWAHFFARGLVNPLEDMNPENKPTHPELLSALSEAFVEANYDLKELARAICNSDPYQRTSRPTAENQHDEKGYSHAPVKVMEARVLLDSLAVVTGQREVSRPAGKNAERSPGGTGGDALVRFFDTREYDDDATEYSYGIPQLLRLMNTSLTASSAAIASRLAGKHKDDKAKVLEELYLLALSRKPTAREVDRLTSYVSKHQDPAKGYAGVLWALLNSAEFVSNH